MERLGQSAKITSGSFPNIDQVRCMNMETARALLGRTVGIPEASYKTPQLSSSRALQSPRLDLARPQRDSHSRSRGATFYHPRPR